jgi:hypothetical protein
MNTALSLDCRISRLGFECAIVVITTAVIAAFLPLDVPEGYSAAHTDRIAWLSESRGMFILGWINQIVAMLSLSGVLLAIAWQIREANALRAILAAATVLISVIAFLIPKFIAVWTIPLLADSVAIDSPSDSLANTLLLLLNVSVPYSLFTSFDYLGFWLYAVFALLVAVPLYEKKLSLRIAAVTLGAFGVIYHILVGALLWGAIPAEEIEGWFLGASSLLLLVVLAMGFNFKGASNRLN